MRWLVVLFICITTVVDAQDSKSFAKALQHDTPRALDRWMKRELHRQRKGVLVTTPSSSYTIHSPTYDSLTTWLRRQPGVVDAEWDRCISKLMLWPGHSTIGVQVRLGGVLHERCYTVQEGRPGTINLPGWRPKVRKSREELKFVGVRESPGFVTEQRGYCEGLSR
ncbi:MAG: hypothetical protein JNL43_00705 [Flavobacteriales bacterium]|nr:hypothetical protein [Flavobacteriales bacterium]